MCHSRTQTALKKSHTLTSVAFGCSTTCCWRKSGKLEVPGRSNGEVGAVKSERCRAPRILEYATTIHNGRPAGTIQYFARTRVTDLILVRGHIEDVVTRQVDGNAIVEGIRDVDVGQKLGTVGLPSAVSYGVFTVAIQRQVNP